MCIVHSYLVSKAGSVKVSSTSGVGNSAIKEQVYVKAQVLALSCIQLTNICQVHVRCGAVYHTTQCYPCSIQCVLGS